MRSAAISLQLLGLLAAVAPAAGDPLAGDPPPDWLVFGGLSAGADYAASFGGLIVAPTGDLWQPGPRLRPSATTGFYRAGAKRDRRTVPSAASALLAGYQFSTGHLSLAVYGGAEAVYLARSDPPHYAAGWHVGGRLVAEAGLTLDGDARAEGHVAYGGALRRLETSARVLSRISGPWRIGPEASYFHKPDGRDLRLGVALARRGPRSGLRAGAGLSLDGEKGATPYLAIGFDQSF